MAGGTQVALDHGVGVPASQQGLGDSVRQRLSPLPKLFRLFLSLLQGLHLPLELLLLLIRLVLCERLRDGERPDERCRQRENANLYRRMTSVLRRVPTTAKGIGRTFLASTSGFRS